MTCSMFTTTWPKKNKRIENLDFKPGFTGFFIYEGLFPWAFLLGKLLMEENKPISPSSSSLEGGTGG